MKRKLHVCLLIGLLTGMIISPLQAEASAPCSDSETLETNGFALELKNETYKYGGALTVTVKVECKDTKYGNWESSLGSDATGLFAISNMTLYNAQNIAKITLHPSIIDSVDTSYDASVISNKTLCSMHHTTSNYGFLNLGIHTYAKCNGW